MRFRDIPIQQKLMTALLLTSGVVLLLACAAFISYEIVTLRKSTVESYLTRARIIAANSTAALAFQNTDDATQVLEALKTDPRVTAACLYDNQARVFAKYPADASAGIFPSKIGVSGYREGYLETFCSIAQEGRSLGTVYLRSDLSALTDRYWAYAWLTAGIVLLSVLAAYLLSRALQGQISAPILSLAKTARAVSDYGNFSIRASKLSGDELGELTDAFNRMLGEIQAQEQALKASETNYREIFDKANDAIYIHDVETGRILDVNQRTCDLFGYAREDFIQGDPRQFMTGNPGYTLEEALRWMKKAAMEGPQVFEWQGKNKDGSLRWVEVSLKRAVIAGKDRLLAFVRDNSDRRKLAEVVENRNFVNAILENIPNMIFVKDAKELRFVMFNKAGENLLGIPRSEMIGKNDYDFFPKTDADFFVSKDRKALEEGKLVDIPEETLQTRHGTRILHTKKFPVMGVDGKPLYLLGISDDITDLKRQQELEMYAKALEVSNRELQDFVFVASHDLQEPLRKVLSFGEFLQEEYGGKLEETGRDYLDRIRSAATRMQILINDLLTLTRVTTKAKPFESVDLNKILREVLSDLEVRIQEKKAKVEIGPLPTLEADSTQMRQLFQNLIGNALKFHRPGVPPEVRVEADAGTEGRLCRIWVRDNGIGFDNKYAEQIFKVFERLHGRDEYEGTGIGLAVCRKVVERHNGTIMAEGFPGQGSTFIVSLPLRQNSKGGKV